MEQRVIISANLQNELTTALTECSRDRIFVLTDETTRELCWPLLSRFLCLKNANTITIPAGDQHKGLDSLSHVWTALSKGGATRHSCLINLGGGMVTDLGGFAASTFKRGINFINIPTTLLSMVDASVGGKTGVNFGGLKNEIGVFNDSKFVILDTVFLRTLDRENLLSGYAEMLKHGLIANETMWAELLRFDIDAQPAAATTSGPSETTLNALGDDTWSTTLRQMLADSVKVKERIVQEDPKEKGLRKALNLGHTFGHAFESWSFRHTSTLHHGADGAGLLHGYAVAFGLVCELWLSAVKCGFPTEQMRQTVSYIREHYGRLPITCDDYPELAELMTHDKKNRGQEINVTLLGGIGDIRINQTVDQQDIEEALDFLREG